MRLKRGMTKVRRIASFIMAVLLVNSLVDGMTLAVSLELVVLALIVLMISVHELCEED